MLSWFKAIFPSKITFLLISAILSVKELEQKKVDTIREQKSMVYVFRTMVGQ